MRRALMMMMMMVALTATMAIACTSGGDAADGDATATAEPDAVTTATAEPDAVTTTTAEPDADTTTAEPDAVTMVNPYRIKRDAARVCPDTDDPTAQGTCPEYVESPGCEAHDDCGSAEVCSHMTGASGPRCACLSLRCLSDDDCDPGFACECAAVTPNLACGYSANFQRCGARCVPAACDSDADCDPGAFCVAAVSHFDNIERYVCSDPSDPANACVENADCDEGFVCVWDESWRCERQRVH